MNERDEWPDLRLTLHPLPWTWRLRPRFYRDDVDGWRGHCSFSWLFLVVEWWANVPMFGVARFTSSDQDATFNASAPVLSEETQ